MFGDPDERTPDGVSVIDKTVLMEVVWIDGLLEYPGWLDLLCRYSLPMDEPEADGSCGQAARAEVPDSAGSASLCGPVLEREIIVRPRSEVPEAGCTHGTWAVGNHRGG